MHYYCFINVININIWIGHLNRSLINLNYVTANLWVNPIHIWDWTPSSEMKHTIIPTLRGKLQKHHISQTRRLVRERKKERLYVPLLIWSCPPTCHICRHCICVVKNHCSFLFWIKKIKKKLWRSCKGGAESETKLNAMAASK